MWKNANLIFLNLNENRNMNATFHIWLEASRPKTLPAAVAPVIMGTAIAYADGKFHLLSFLVALICALLIQIGTNYANDYFDFVKGADVKERTGPRRATAAGLVSPDRMKKAFILVFSVTFILGLILVARGGLPILLIGIFSILFGILYTGGPYPLGYNGLGDIFVLIFFGPVAVGGTYYVQALDITPAVIILGLAPGLISTAILTVNNLRDINTDTKTGKRTLAVRFGKQFAYKEYIISIIAAILIPIYWAIKTQQHLNVLIILGLLFPGVKLIKKVMSLKGPQLNEVLAATGKFLFFYSIIFSFGWIL